MLVAACLAPSSARAKPVGEFRFVVTAPGDQTDPSIDGRFVVFAGPSPSGDLDVFLYDSALASVAPLAAGAGHQDSPDVSAAGVVHRAPEGIAIDLWGGERLRSPRGEDGVVSNPVIGASVAAWELGWPGDRDIRVAPLRSGAEYTLGGVGDQLAPSAHGALVAYLDGGDGGAVWVHDSATGGLLRVCGGVASGVSIGDDGSDVVLAVARSARGTDEDIEVYDLAGNLRAALAVPGVQRNPHLSRDWVAFEDVSTAVSQVVLWNWKTGLLFLPHPTTTQQVLNDVSVVFPTEVRVVFEDSASPATGRDIVLYVLDTDPAIDFDDRPNGYPFDTGGDPPEDPPARADCDDPGAVVLGTLELERGNGKPEAGEVVFAAPAPDGARELPVLVCVDAERVSAGWLGLDGEAIARPGDLEPQVVRLERLAAIAGGEARLSGVIAGKQGASLRARVLADPARAATGGERGAGVAAKESATPGPSMRPGGCGSAGVAGAGSLLLLAALLAARVRRRG